MEDSTTATTLAVDPRHVGYTHLMYALHAASVVIGIVSTAFIVSAFLLGWPSIIAVIMNYARRRAVQDTWLATHFRWQLRTFWWALAWVVIATLLFGPFTLILIGIFPMLGSYALIGLWVAYRIARGWLALRDGRTVPA